MVRGLRMRSQHLINVFSVGAHKICRDGAMWMEKNVCGHGMGHRDRRDIFEVEWWLGGKARHMRVPALNREVHRSF